MAINCGLGWQHDALIEALGTPAEDGHQPDSAAPGIRLHVMRWRCGDEGLVSAVKAPYEHGYTVEVFCGHPEHRDIARMSDIGIADVSLVDGDAKALDRIPNDLDGVRLRFKLNSPVTAYARVDVAPDLEGHGPLAPTIHVHGGRFGPGTALFDLPLTAVDKLEDPLRHDAQVSVHVLHPKTAMKDRNARGLCLWSADYRVRPTDTKP